MIYRIVHAALTAHWVLLAALWLTLKEDASTPSVKLAAAWAALAAVTAATQPYLGLMVVVLMLAAYAGQAFASRKPLLSAAHAAIGLAAAGVALWQSGSLMVRGEEGLAIGGFGVWSTNLLAFIMPTEGFSLFWPGPFRYAHREQYEGYAYLGLGTLLLAAVVVGRSVISFRSFSPSGRIWRRLPFAAALLFLTAMALGPKITFGSMTLFSYDMAWWGPLTIFRTSGRMIWPLYYAVVVAILFAACRLPYRRAVVLCALAVLVQAVDVAGMTRYVRDVQSFGFRNPLVNRFWDVAPAHYDSVVLIPPNFCVYEGYVDFLPFALFAGTHGLSINSGMTARFDVPKARAYCQDLRREMAAGLGADRALYVLRLDLLPQVMERAGASLTCTALDGFGVCFTAASHARWADTFDLPRSRLPDLSEFLGFYEELNNVYRTELGRAAGEAPGPLDERIEGVVRYLAYRMEGCDDGEAERQVIAQRSARAVRWCANLSIHHEFPAADQTYAFSGRWRQALAAKGVSTTTHVDPEGEAVWLQAYARERARGARAVDARATVLATIRGPAR